MLKCR